MSDSSTAIFPRSTNVKVKESDVINSGRDTSHMTYNVQNSYSIVFPDAINVIQHFVAWIRSTERDPVEISDIVPLQIPSLPVSSVADRYTRSMLECLVGYPLYNPKPFSESKEYLRHGVNIGDVGFVRMDGTFDCLFNVCPSQNSLINSPSHLPDGFSLKTPNDSATRNLDSLPRDACLCPQTVVKTESDEYLCKESEGATLVLPEGAVSAEAIYIGRLEDLAKRRGVDWYEYAKAQGRSVSNGSLYLVTSFTKCTQWGIAVFDRPCGPGQGLTFVSNPLGWKGSGIFRTKVADPNQEGIPNQCVFLRGYKIMLRQDIFDKLPTRQLASRIRGGGGTGFTSRVKNILTSEKPLTGTTKSTVTKSDEVILHANFNSSPIHPLDLINAKLLSQNPDAKAVLTHDGVWCDILRDNFLKGNYEALMNTARSYTSTIDEYGCISLGKISDSSNVLAERSCPVGGTDLLDLTGQLECTTELIGRGVSACVYRGRWVEENANAERPPIVVKVMNLVPLPIDERRGEMQSEQIKRELEVWRKIDHKNIVPLLGIANINPDANIPAFVSPWMENGNAKQFRLRNPSFPPLLILYDIIQGLHYLHTSEPEIVHGNIKAANVLINDRYEACLCDFGLTQFLVDSTVAQAGGTLRWMSPELMIRNERTPTKESDVYAYAMTCYEIITCDVPFKLVSNEANLIYNVTVEKQRPEHVESCNLDDMWDIITKCWAEEPEDRPRTAEVLELFRQRKENSGSLPLPSSFSVGQSHHSGERLGSGPELAAEEPRTNMKITRKGNRGTGEIETSVLVQPKRYSSAPSTVQLNLSQGKIHQRNPYTGTEKSLVIGIDVGTTLSGVSFAVLEPGKVPQISPVVQFSGQREEKHNSKVPSVVCYDQDGHVIAAGPETDNERNHILSMAEGVRREEWFKLRLRPPHLAVDKRAQLEKIWCPPEPASAEEIDDYSEASEADEGENDGLLDIEGIWREIVQPDETPNKKRVPRPVTHDFNKTAVQVFADFLQYLFKSAKEYIIETERYKDLTFTWSSIERNIYFVLTHPNGWEGKQQSQMREAAVAAGLVDRSTAANRITFVTEGEAALHFCLDKNPELHQVSGGLLVVDCGGGTINLSAYSQTEKGGYKEIVSPDCLLQGSIFVTSRARDYFKGRFKDSQYGADDDVEAMARAFDKPEGAKCMFRNPTTPYFIKFGRLHDNDRKYGITNGKFKVDGPQVAKFFEPAIQDIIGGIINQCRHTKDGVSIKYVLLVGGFGRSDYLYARLRDYFKSSGIVVLRPDNAHINKAVADGSVSWYLDRYVSTRVARFSYGVMTRHLYNDKDPDHLNRESKKETQANGKSYIPGIFSTVLKKDSEVSEETLFRQPHKFILTRGQFAAWTTISTRLKCYRGKAADPPKWVDREPNSFHDVCTIQADMSRIKQNMKLHKNGTKLFYKLDFEVVILLGFTELKAYVIWKEDGVEKQTDASVFYD